MNEKSKVNSKVHVYNALQAASIGRDMPNEIFLAGIE